MWRTVLGDARHLLRARARIQTTRARGVPLHRVYLFPPLPTKKAPQGPQMGLLESQVVIGSREAGWETKLLEGVLRRRHHDDLDGERAPLAGGEGQLGKTARHSYGT